MGQWLIATSKVTCSGGWHIELKADSEELRWALVHETSFRCPRSFHDLLVKLLRNFLMEADFRQQLACLKISSISLYAAGGILCTVVKPTYHANVVRHVPKYK